jgi:dsRNA-specific ribonuclease
MFPLFGFDFSSAPKTILVRKLLTPGLTGMTHASSTSGSQSLERLEFLGDSILDNIVVIAMYGQEPQLSHFQMHLLRTVLVNADFLAFIGMEWAVEQEIIDLVEASTTGEDGETKEVSFCVT